MAFPKSHRGLSAKQERALVALLSEPTVQRAAETAKVGLRTLHRWIEEPAFRDAYRALRRQAYDHAVALMQQSCPAAVATLARVMTDPSAPHAAKVSASTSLLKNAREGIELDDIDARLKDLERAAAEDEKKKEAR